MDPALGEHSFRTNAFLVLQGLPRGSVAVLDGSASVTDTHFEGYKLVPPGLHLFAWSAASGGEATADIGGVAMRSALLRYVSRREVVLRHYDVAADSFRATGDAGAGAVMSDDQLMALDAHLAPYPSAWQRHWQQLTKNLARSQATVARVFAVDMATADAICDSFTGIAGGEAAPDALNEDRASQQQQSEGTSNLRFTTFEIKASWPAGARGADRTKWSVDKSWLFNDVLQRAAAAEMCAADDAQPLLRELELCFVLFFCVHNAAALEHWTGLVALVCRSPAQLGAPGHLQVHPCEWEADTERPSSAVESALVIHAEFLATLRAQFEALPPTAFTEELVSCADTIIDNMSQLKTNIARSLSAAAAQGSAAQAACEELHGAWRALHQTMRDRFAWDFQQTLDEEEEAADESGDDAPVIVDVSATSYSL